MPTYDFFCPDCDLKYAKFLRQRAAGRAEAPCPVCAKAHQAGLSAPAHVFQDGRDVQKDPDARGESGVYGLDYSTDKNVGRDATARWEAVNDRSSSKRQLHHYHTRPWRSQIPEGKEARVALKRNPINGEYEPMMTGEVRANTTFRGEGRQALNSHRKARQEAGIPELDRSSGLEGDLAQGREAFGAGGRPVVKPEGT